MAAVVIVSMVVSVSDYQKESQFIALNKFNDAKNVITIKRGGQKESANIDDLKTGDVVQIKPGLSIPCDGILLPGSTGVVTDESAMTGESDEIIKMSPELCQEKKEEFL